MMRLEAKDPEALAPLYEGLGKPRFASNQNINHYYFEVLKNLEELVPLKPIDVRGLNHYYLYLRIDGISEGIYKAGIGAQIPR